MCVRRGWCRVHRARIIDDKVTYLSNGHKTQPLSPLPFNLYRSQDTGLIYPNDECMPKA